MSRLADGDGHPTNEGEATAATSRACSTMGVETSRVGLGGDLVPGLGDAGRSEGRRRL